MVRGADAPFGSSQRVLPAAVEPRSELRKRYLVFRLRQYPSLKTRGWMSLSQTVNKFCCYSAWIRGSEFEFVGCEPVAQVHRPVAHLVQILKFLRKVIFGT